MQFKRILCPTDLSMSSLSGIVCACSFARDHQAHLIIFHVVPIPIPSLSQIHEAEMFPFRSHAYLPPTIDQVLREADGRVNDFVNSALGMHLTWPWHSRVSVGDVTKEIVAASCREEADLIVMAKRQQNILGRMLSRSVSERVSRDAPCPVFTVCPSKIQRPPEARRWPVWKAIPEGAQG